MYIELSSKDFILEPRYYFYGWTSSPVILGRRSAVAALKRAQKLLPKGYHFKIWDMQRSRKVQLKMIGSFRRRLRALHPTLPKQEQEKLVYVFAAKPIAKVRRHDTHRNGGAVDLTICNARGEELYMGTDHDDLTAQAGTLFYLGKTKTVLEREAAKNRTLLIKVMEKAGFENYSPEWWHWSYPKP
jgi:D-alanyl-D-alanine dipeptidase